MVVAVALVVFVLFAGTLAALVASVRRERRRVAALEARLRTLEAESATTVVFEPAREPRAPRELLN